MWIWIGVVAMSAAGLALFRLSGNVTRIVVGVALAICLGIVAVMFWLDRRAEGSNGKNCFFGYRYT